ncbi:MAG: hypothetical protein CVU17_08910 [Betaproteobacteria bacterium HGW-Betaproteobacteria-11]|jgi:hemerythrin-like metal-binding protein|nr:MAG: hypothetical protein CVU17_08910 [Betaproteobacteria bacterium HGW-Betaproteobacteria-11]
MQWKDAYSVGIHEIDRQHKELLRLFSKLSGLIGKSESWSDVHYQIVELRHFAEFHFAFEEALMRLFGYPQADTHMTEHEAFFEKMDVMQRSSLLSEVKNEMVKFLFDWFTKHILVIDMGYAKFILTGVPIVKSGG